MTVTTTFAEMNGKTTVTVTTLFATIAMKEDCLGVGMAESILSGFDQLEGVALALSGRRKCGAFWQRWGGCGG